MKRKTNSPKFTKKSGDGREEDLSGYPYYPENEDIYAREEETDLDPEQPSKPKVSGQQNRKLNEKDFREDVSGGDLDVPGAELDDNQEDIGSEDEENNHYSLGGDNHNNLEEKKGD